MAARGRRCDSLCLLIREVDSLRERRRPAGAAALVVAIADIVAVVAVAAAVGLHCWGKDHGLFGLATTLADVWIARH